METARDDASRLRLMLTEYAVELANETPVLCRFTDCISESDGLGGYEERERDRAYRRHLMHPTDQTTLAACIDCLMQLRDCNGAWVKLRGALLTGNQPGIAAELKERRERRTADIERMIAAVRDLAPMMPTDEDILNDIAGAPEQSTVGKYDLLAVLNGKAEPTEGRTAEMPNVRVLDFRAWDAAAVRFNDGIAADVAYLQTTVAETLVAAFADYNDRLMRTGGKPILKAAAQFALPPDVSSKGARAVLQMLNDPIGIVPPAKFAELDVFEIINAFERKYADLSDIRGRLDDIRADTNATAMNVAAIANGVDWLVTDRKEKAKQNKKRGKDNQAKGNDEERKRAARDMKTALNRVHDRMKNGATIVMAECRAVCTSFKPLTSRKDAMGRYADCEPLTGAGGKEIKPETLAKNYRKKYGTK